MSMDHRRMVPRRRIGRPGAPTITAAVEANPVQWLPPTSNGGSPITEYRVYVNGDLLFETVAAPETSTVNSVAGGAAVQVSAVNAVGEGPKSATVIATA